jgi:hypothetical protein
VIAPEVPAGSLIGQAVLDDESHGQGNDAMSVVPLGGSQVGSVGVEILAAFAAVMLGVGEVNIPRAPGDKITDVVQHAVPRSIPIAGLAAPRTAPMLEVATLTGDFRLGQLFRPGNPLGRVRQIFSGTGHDTILLGQMVPAKKLPRTVADVMIDSRQ